MSEVCFYILIQHSLKNVNVVYITGAQCKEASDFLACVFTLLWAERKNSPVSQLVFPLVVSSPNNIY